MSEIDKLKAAQRKIIEQKKANDALAKQVAIIGALGAALDEVKVQENKDGTVTIFAPGHRAIIANFIRISLNNYRLTNFYPSPTYGTKTFHDSFASALLEAEPEKV